MMSTASRVRFRHLQTFLEVSRQKSVARAAEILNVSQPAVTKTLRELEAALGVAVVEREGARHSRHAGRRTFLRLRGAAVTALKEGVEFRQARRRGRHRSARTDDHVLPMEGPGLGVDLLPQVFERQDLICRRSELP